MDTDGKKSGDALAAELRAERGAKELSIEALADRAGLHKVTVMRYLKGDRDIPVPAFYQLAQALGVSPTDLLDKAEDRFRKSQLG